MTQQILPTLDFLCVGAPRSGTTTLHKILSQHPEISLPTSKELPIFHRSDFSPELWKRLVKAHWFPKKGLIGKVTPQYWTEPYLPQKLRTQFPNIKILIVLREPVNRFVSAYRMRWVRGWESRTFKEFLSDALNPASLKWAREHSLLRHYGDPAPFIAIAGEYHRILSNWLNIFPSNQVHIIVFEEMVAQPQKVFDEIFSCLGIPPIKVSTLPRENTPASSWMMGTFSRAFLALHTRLGRIGEKFIDNSSTYARFVFLSSLNLRVRREPPPPTPDDIERLKSFYRDEISRLTTLLKHLPPWALD